MSLLVHRNTKDETGKIYGRLTVLKIAGTIHKTTAWLCRCSCGIETIKRGSSMRNGQVRSCGCLALETQIEIGKKHQKIGTNSIRRYPKPSAKWLSFIKHRYGILPKQWTKLILRSNGCCEICGNQFKNTSQFLNVDHDHKTDQIRGILCGRCNGMLAGLEDKEFCLKATMYLQERGD